MYANTENLEKAFNCIYCMITFAIENFVTRSKFIIFRITGEYDPECIFVRIRLHNLIKIRAKNYKQAFEFKMNASESTCLGRHIKSNHRSILNYRCHSEYVLKDKKKNYISDIYFLPT